MRPTRSTAPRESTWQRRICLGATLFAVLFTAGCEQSTAYGERRDKSDLNKDGVVNLADLKLYAEAAGLDFYDEDWCEYILDHAAKEERYGELFDFIYEHFECAGVEPPPEDPLEVENTNDYPIRMAWGPQGKLYVSDSKVGSVFIYDSDLNVTGELKGFDRPLGVVVDNEGRIYVGNDGSDSIEVFDAEGSHLSTIGAGTILMPNDMELDANGNLYVVDSRSDLVRVYDSNGVAIGTITDEDLRFPSSLALFYRDDGAGQLVGELYVADQGHHKIKVFDLDGNFLRAFGRQVPSFGTSWQGRFNCLQSLAVDATGAVHVLDTYLKRVQILSATGSFITSYGEPGAAEGQLGLPLEIEINALGQVAVSDYRKHRVEILTTVP